MRWAAFITEHVLAFIRRTPLRNHINRRFLFRQRVLFLDFFLEPWNSPTDDFYQLDAQSFHALAATIAAADFDAKVAAADVRQIAIAVETHGDDPFIVAAAEFDRKDLFVHVNRLRSHLAAVRGHAETNSVLLEELTVAIVHQDTQTVLDLTKAFPILLTSHGAW